MKKSQIIILVVGVLIAIGVFEFLNGAFRPEPQSLNEQAQEMVFSIIDEGVDYTNSLYPVEDQPVINEKLKTYEEGIRDANEITPQDIDGIMSWFFTANDYQHVLELAKASDLLGTEDFSYRVVRAKTNLKIGNIDTARTELQTIKMEWGVPDTYITLADTYKATPDTPNQVIDDIYLEAIERIVGNGRFEIILAYTEWLEESDREELTLEYYEELNSLLPQDELKDRITELKQKYK